MNKTFNRRQAFGLLATSLGMIYTMKSALAQTAPDAPTLECPPLPKKLIKVVESEISKNHGHEFTIEMDQLIKESGNSFSIQGDSGHAHKILIAADQIVKFDRGLWLSGQFSGLGEAEFGRHLTGNFLVHSVKNRMRLFKFLLF